MTTIFLRLSPAREALYTEALLRLHDVELTDTEEDADAVIASALGDRALPTLLDQPELADQAVLRHSGDRPLMPALQWRFAPEILPVEESHASGQLGDPGLLRTHHWTTRPLSPRTTAFHQVDLARWFFGDSPTRHHTVEREHYLQIHLGFPGNGMALLDLATNRPGEDDYFSLHLVGSRGAAYADDHRNSHLHFGAGGTRALLHGQNELLALQGMVREFVGGLRDQRPWRVSADDAIDALTTLKEVTNG